MKRRNSLALLICCAACAQTPPQSRYESEASRRTRSLAESTARSPRDLLTRAEQTGFTETGRYQETLDWVQRLEKRTPLLRVITMGMSPQARPIIMVVVSRERNLTPPAAARSAKPLVLVQNGIHAGEIAGKDASAMLLRDLTVTGKYSILLDRVNLLVIPVFNVDGHERFSAYNRINQNGPREMGFRVTAQRPNLNRDYIKADAPEMRAWLRMYRAWLPDLLIDNHVTDGEDFQYDLTISMPTEQDIWATVGHWARERFRAPLMRAMEQDGHIIGLYGGERAEIFSPRYSTGYAAAQNRAALLVETHSLKPYRTRVWAHYDIMRHSLELAASEAAALKQAVREADHAIAAQEGRSLYVDGRISRQGEPFTYHGLAYRREKSEITGAPVPVYEDRAVNETMQYFERIETTAAPVVPHAYALPPEWTAVKELLEAHGVRTEALASDAAAEVETCRFSAVKWSEQPYEGRHPLTFQTTWKRGREVLRAGTVIVPMAQRGARVALNILEPDAPDGAVRWGFFDTVFEPKEYYSAYIMEPIARRMLESDPGLRREFEARLRRDPAFAASPRERLNFFYERSPYADRNRDLYPVLRVIRLEKR